jgi:predicted small lipoprotein YifL
MSVPRGFKPRDILAMMRDVSGSAGVTKLCGRPTSSLALIAVLVAALGLAACGRKAGLDPPPVAGIAPTEQASAPPIFGPAPVVAPATDQDDEAGGGPGRGSIRAGSKTGGRRDLPPPAQVPQRSLPIDVLLN